MLGENYRFCTFCLIFNKEFYCVPHTIRGIRMIDLMGTMKLHDRIVLDLNFGSKTPIDFKKVNLIRERLIVKSYNNLKEVLFSG